MITSTRVDYIKDDIVVRTYQADTFSEAFEFATYWGGQVKKITTGFKIVFKIQISNQ